MFKHQLNKSTLGQPQHAFLLNARETVFRTTVYLTLLTIRLSETGGKEREGTGAEMWQGHIGAGVQLSG